MQPVCSVWVIAVVSISWAELTYIDGPASPNETAQIPMLKYQAPVRMTNKVRTLHRDRWSLVGLLFGTEDALLRSRLEFVWAHSLVSWSFKGQSRCLARCGIQWEINQCL